jgi:predicted GNAT family acetyltransferase
MGRGLQTSKKNFDSFNKNGIMTVQHKNSESRGMFYVEYEDEVAAEMIYTIPSAGKMIIEHTEVDEVLRGKNIGVELVHAAVEYARNHGIKVIVTCPFAQKVFSRKPDWQDVLDK